MLAACQSAADQVKRFFDPDAVAHEASGLGNLPKRINGRKGIAGRQGDRLKGEIRRLCAAENAIDIERRAANSDIKADTRVGAAMARAPPVSS
jgi:hypothetical protein